jgi:hypothetical protein
MRLDFLIILPFVMACYFISHGYALITVRALDAGGRLRGRRTVTLWVSLIVVAALLVGLGVADTLGIAEPGSAEATARDHLFAGLLLLPAAFLCGLTALYLVRALPPRRRTGPLNSVNTVLSRMLRVTARISVVLALAVIWGAFAVGFATHPPDGFEIVIAVVLVPFTTWIFLGIGSRIARLLNEYANRLAASSSKGGVPRGRFSLYLRPFEEENRLFAEGKTFEEFLAADIASRLGRLVALGNPTDRLSPAGAERVYEPDSSWQAALTDLARSAACIVGVTSASVNTNWELTRIRELNLQERLFLLSPPKTVEQKSGREFSRSPLGRRLGAGMKLVKAYFEEDMNQLSAMLSFGKLPAVLAPAGLTTWPEFSEALTSGGYIVAIEDPGPGAVIGFDGTGAAVALATGANSREEFVAPLVQWLRQPGIDHRS